MKDLNEIKYETGKYDEEGNPIYITEAEFREHGIYTLQEDEELDENDNIVKVEKQEKIEEPKKRFDIILFIKSILVGLFVLLLSCPFIFGMVQILILGIGGLPYPEHKADSIGCIIISIGGILLALGIAVLVAYSKYKKRLVHGQLYPDEKKKKDPNDLSGTYTTFGYTRPDGTKITHVHKDK